MKSLKAIKRMFKKALNRKKRRQAEELKKKVVMMPGIRDIQILQVTFREGA